MNIVSVISKTKNVFEQFLSKFVIMKMNAVYEINMHS